MAIACLAKISPLNRATGLTVDIYVSSRDDRRMTGLNGQVWEPALVQAPQLGISLWNGDFTQAVDVARAMLLLNMETAQKTWPGADAYMWVGAPVTIYAEEPGTGWPWTTRFVGTVSGFSRRSQVLSLTAEANTAPLSAKVLGTIYAGTGGAEGGSDLKNKPKPLILGWAQNVEPTLLDPVYSIYQFSGYGPIEAVTTLYERGSDFGASYGDYATYAALAAAAIPAGQWATCLAAGLIRLGAPAYGVITGDVKGHKIGSTTPRLPGSVINGLLTVAGISTSYVDLTSLAALDTNVPYPINVVVTDQTTFLDIARKIALSCNYQAGVSLLGTFFAAQITLTGPEILTLHAQGLRWPQVFTSDEVDVSPPYNRTIMGANRSWRVHTADEVALATTAEETATAAYLAALERGKVTVGGAFPSDAQVGDTHITADGVFYERINAGGISLGGSSILLAAAAPFLQWTKSAVQPSQMADWASITGNLKPEDGADVTSLITGIADITINATYTGAIITGLPLTQPYRLMRNGVDVTTGATWSVEVISGVVAASIGTNTGLLSVNAVSGNLTSSIIRVTALYNDTIRTIDLRLTRVVSAAPVTSGPTATGTIGNAVASASMVAVGGDLVVTVAAGGVVTLNAEYTFTLTSEYSGNMVARWYRWNGAAYVAIGSEIPAQSPASIYGDEYTAGSSTGYGVASLTDTGRTPGATDGYRLYMRNDTGTATRNVTGTNSAVST